MYSVLILRGYYATQKSYMVLNISICVSPNIQIGLHNQFSRHIHTYVHTCTYICIFHFIAHIYYVYSSCVDAVKSPDQGNETATEAKSDEKVAEPAEDKSEQTGSKEPEKDGPKMEETKLTNDTEKERTSEKAQQSDGPVKNETKSESVKSSDDKMSTNTTTSSNNTKVTTKLEVVKETLEVETINVDIASLSTQAVVESKSK